MRRLMNKGSGGTKRPSTPSRTSAAKAASISLALPALAILTCSSAGRAAASTSLNVVSVCALPGFTSTATRTADGTSSRRSASRFGRQCRVGMAGRMAVSVDGSNTGGDFLTPLVFGHLVFDAGIDLPHIGEIVLHHLVGLCFRRILFAHPEVPVLRWHHDFRVGERHRTVGGANTVGVIGMQVRHQYDIDALGLDAGGDEIGDGAADCPLARLKKRTAKPAVDQDQL